MRSTLDRPDAAKGGRPSESMSARMRPSGAGLKESVGRLFREHGLPYIQSGTDHLAEMEPRFGLTGEPAPVFPVLDREMTLRGTRDARAPTSVARPWTKQHAWLLAII